MFPLLALLALAATGGWSLPSSAVSANCDRNATVVAGDTCDIISAKFNVSTYQLAAANTDIDARCDNLHANEVICLGIKGQDCEDTYVVQTNDTCVKIAGAHNITENTLLTNNPNLNQICTNMYPGEVLCVSNTIYVNLTETS